MISNNTLWTLEDADIPNFPPLRALNCANGDVLQFKFSYLEDDVLKALEIEKPVP